MPKSDLSKIPELGSVWVTKSPRDGVSEIRAISSISYYINRTDIYYFSTHTSKGCYSAYMTLQEWETWAKEAKQLWPIP